jgi:hypothetical protein
MAKTKLESVTAVALVAAGLAWLVPFAAHASECSPDGRNPAAVGGDASCVQEPKTQEPVPALPDGKSTQRPGDLPPWLFKTALGVTLSAKLGEMAWGYFMATAPQKFDLSSCAGASKILFGSPNFDRSLKAFQTLDDMRRALKQGAMKDPVLSNLTKAQAKELEETLDDFVKKIEKGEVDQARLERVAKRLQSCFDS